MIDPNSSDAVLSPEQLDVFGHRISDIRTDLYCCEQAGMSPMAEQHVILALDALSAAMAHLKLVKYHLMQKL